MNEAEVKLPWPDWKIIKRAGRGGFAVVYEAERISPGSTVERSAIKIIQIPSSLQELNDIRYDSNYDTETTKAAIDKMVNATTKEIAALERLKGHPNIVHIEDYAVEKELIPDESIYTYTVYIREELLNSLPDLMDETQVLRMGIHICTALQALESIKTDDGKSIIHRDISPSNILVSEVFGQNTYKLTDFGIVRETGFDTYITRDTGKSLYTPPEVQAYGIPTPTMDLYSLSLTMYVLLNKSYPFISKEDMKCPSTVYAANSKRLQGAEIPAPVCTNEQLAKIILKGIAFNPEDRYQSASEMLEDLHKIHAQPTTIRAIMKFRIKTFFSSNMPYIVSLIVIVLIICFAVPSIRAFILECLSFLFNAIFALLLLIILGMVFQ